MVFTSVKVDKEITIIKAGNSLFAQSGKDVVSLDYVGDCSYQSLLDGIKRIEESKIKVGDMVYIVDDENAYASNEDFFTREDIPRDWAIRYQYARAPKADPTVRYKVKFAEKPWCVLESSNGCIYLVLMEYLKK